MRTPCQAPPPAAAATTALPAPTVSPAPTAAAGSYAGNPFFAEELVEFVQERSGAIANLSGLVAVSSLLALLALVAVQRSSTRRREYQALGTIVYAYM